MATTKTIADVREQAWRLLHDVGDTAAEQYLTNDTLDALLPGAVRQYAEHRPLLVQEDVVADGTSLTNLPTAWTEGYSSLSHIETPADETPPTIMDSRGYQLYLGTDGDWRVQWLSTIPANLQVVRFAFNTIPAYAAASGNSTVPDVDFEAVSYLLAAVGAETIAARMGGQSETSITADRSSRTITRVEEWLKIAANFRRQYANTLGIPRDGIVAASGWANWDTKTSDRKDWLTHPSRNR